jgi:hypothetical protein
VLRVQVPPESPKDDLLSKKGRSLNFKKTLEHLSGDLPTKNFPDFELGLGEGGRHMPGKRCSPEQIISKLREAEAQAAKQSFGLSERVCAGPSDNLARRSRV